MELKAGDFWEELIGNALKSAAAVVVLWSKQSVESVRIRDEASYGLNKSKI